MLTIIILLTLGAGLFWLGVKKETAPATLLGGALCLAAVVCLLTLININKRFEEEKEHYANLKMQVEDYNTLPDSCKNISFEYDIREDVLRMNNSISNHKVMSRSPWVNLWHSKEIGDLEKLRVYGPRERRE